MARKSKKWFRMTYAKPRRWLTKHRWGIIKAARAGGFAAGFTGGAIGAWTTGIPHVWFAGILSGTIGGDILARKGVRALRKKVPKRTTYKVPRVRLPTPAQVVTAPVAIPFKVGEAYGKGWVRHQKKTATRSVALVPTRKKNPFIPKKNIFVR